jgi:divalent metal cation (Fe/Co/Zn/Cd) transporter
MRNDNKYHERSVAAKKSTLISVVVNFFLSFTQILTGLFSGSQGLIADGIHSLSDLIADFVVLFANKKAVNLQTMITIMGTGVTKTARR